MTSTEFTVGLDGSRVSSKVLKPPGGGSSDIFGFGTSGNSTANGTTTQEKYKSMHPADTQSRLFGSSSDASPVVKSNRMQSNVFASECPAAVRSMKKKYVHRNPITGEEIEIDPEKYQKTETSVKEENGDKDVEEEKNEELPTKPIQTSIRVRNPPGGKSSGIF